MMSGRRVGVDLGGTKTLAAVFDKNGALISSRKQPTHREEGPEAVLGRAGELISSLEAETGRADAIGVGFAGLIDHRNGVVDSSVILPGFDGWPLAAWLGERLGRPVTADNDATAAGIGELEALGRPPSLNMILLTLGTGIGGAIVIDGKIYRGSTNTSAEFGNTTIDWQGRECPSGNRGSLNSLASGTALAQRAAELLSEHPTSSLRDADRIDVEQLSAAAGRGDALAIRVLDEGARALGAGIANFVNLFNPDRVVLMGGLCRVQPSFLETAREEVARRAFPLNGRHVDVVEATRGELTGALGAAALAAHAEGADA